MGLLLPVFSFIFAHQLEQLIVPGTLLKYIISAVFVAMIIDGLGGRADLALNTAYPLHIIAEKPEPEGWRLYGG